MSSSTSAQAPPPGCPASDGKVFLFPSSARVEPADAVPPDFPDRVLDRYAPPEQLARRRGAWWGMVAACCHAAPPQRLLEDVAEGTVVEEIHTFFGAGAADPFEEVSASDGAAVRLDHDALFKVPGPQYLTPNESVWADRHDLEGNERRKPLLMGPATVDAMRRYGRFHLELDGSTGELADFIGFELMFMEQLCGLEAVAWEKGEHAAVRFLVDQQRSWIEDHLARWAIDLCAAMHEKAASPFYRGLARLIPEILRHEREILAYLLEE